MSVSKIIINEKKIEIPDTMCSLVGIYKKGYYKQSEVLPDMDVKYTTDQVVIFIATDHPDHTNELFNILKPIVTEYIKKNL